MPGGAFNTAALIAELGLKPVGPDEMRVGSAIQPVLVAADLSSLTPPHVPASGFWGNNLVGAAGLNATMQLQCLGPGGCFVDWFMILSSQLVKFAVRAVATTTATPLALGGQTSRDTPLSVVTTDAILSIGGTFGITGDTGGASHLGLFVPKGQFFIIQSLVANTSMSVSLKIREVPAAENL